MKIAVFADLHAHIYKDFDGPNDDYESQRLANIVHSLHFIHGYVMGHHIDYTLFAGDLFHTRSKVDTLVYNSIKDALQMFYFNKNRVLAIPGNHDQYDHTDYPQHSLYGFKNLIYVQDRLDIVPIGEGITVTCVPYSKNVGMIKEFLSSLKAEDLGEYPILMFHLGISGGVTGSKSYPLAEAFTPEDLRPELFKWVVGGHFHKHQLLGGYDHMMYVGSPIQHDFGDAGDDRGFVVIDTEAPQGLYTFVPIPNPKFIEVSMPLAPHSLDLFADMGDYVKVSLKESEVQDFLAICPPNLQYKMELEREFEEDIRVDVKIGMTPEDIVAKYADEFMPEAKDIGLELLREVQE